ncbi:MAG: hypothetical protein AAF387_12345 [Pseudomonadota bacterium]
MTGISIPGASFIARGYTEQSAQLLALTTTALRHVESGKGFAYLEVLSPCVTYNDTYRTWRTEVYDVDQESGYDPSDKASVFARLLTLRSEGRLPTGLLFTRERPAFEADAFNSEFEAAALQDIALETHRKQHEQTLRTFMR